PVQLEGIGVSATGQIDSKSGVVIGSAGHIDHYLGSAIKQTIEERFLVETTVINDANAMILGELWLGNAQGYQNVVGITLGTGIGGGIVVEGKLLQGARGLAGELGHFSIDATGALCTCGNRGCYERLASTKALVQQVQAVFPQENIDGRWIFAHVGDPVVHALLDTWIQRVGCGLVSLIHIFNPELVLIGGGVSEQEVLLIEPIREYLKQHAMPRFVEQLNVKAAKFKNSSGLLGAVYYHIQEKGNK
ncbi:MAG: ROK family protein, partial [Erysipelotrichaceae bacterium]